MDVSNHHAKSCILRRLQMKKRTHANTKNWFTEPMDVCYTRLESHTAEERPHVRRRTHHHGGERIGEASNPGPGGALKKKVVKKASNVRHLLYCECTECHNVSKCTTPHVHSYKTGAEGRLLRKNKGARQQRTDQSKPKPQCKAYKCHDLKCTAEEHRHFPFKSKILHEDGDFFVCPAMDVTHSLNDVDDEEFFDKFQEAEDQPADFPVATFPGDGPPPQHFLDPWNDIPPGLQEDDDEQPGEILPPLVPPLLRREYTTLTPPSAENEHKHGDRPHAEDTLESRKSEPLDEPRLAGTKSGSSPLENIAPLPLTQPREARTESPSAPTLQKILQDVTDFGLKLSHDRGKIPILPRSDENNDPKTPVEIGAAVDYDADEDEESSPSSPVVGPLPSSRSNEIPFAWEPPPDTRAWRALPRRARTGAERNRNKKRLEDWQTVGIPTLARHKHIREHQDSFLPHGLREVLLYNNTLVKKRRMYVSEWLFNRKKAREEQPLIPWRSLYQFIEDVCTRQSSVQRIYEQDATFRAYNLLVDSSVTVGRSGEVRDQLKQEFVCDLLGDKYNSVSRAVIHVELFEHLMGHAEILDRPALSADNKLRTTLFYSLGAVATKWAKDNVDNPHVAILSHAVRSDTLTYVFQQKYLEGLRRLKAIPNVVSNDIRPLNDVNPAPKTARRGAM